MVKNLLRASKSTIAHSSARVFNPYTNSKMSSHTMALLDDYAGIAPPYFDHIQNLKVDSYPETILPTDEKGIEALTNRLKPYPIICSMRERTPFPREVFARLPNLKLLVTTGLRNLSIDLPAARDHGVVVAGTTGKREITHAKLPQFVAPAPTYDATTQQCFSLLLSLTSRIPIDNAVLRAGGPFQTGLGMTVSNKVFGCVGLGRLGTNAARTAILGFGMKVVAWSANLTQEKADEAAAGIGLPRGSIKAVSHDHLFQTADVVSVHYLLSERSRGIVGAKELALMKRTALLLNTSRGPLIDEDALLDTLNNGRIRGAGLDVFWIEPLPVGSPWRTTKWGQDGRSEVVLSPHMGKQANRYATSVGSELTSTHRIWRGRNIAQMVRRAGRHGREIRQGGRTIRHHDLSSKTHLVSPETRYNETNRISKEKKKTSGRASSSSSGSTPNHRTHPPQSRSRTRPRG